MVGDHAPVVELVSKVFNCSCRSPNIVKKSTYPARQRVSEVVVAFAIHLNFVKSNERSLVVVVE